MELERVNNNLRNSAKVFQKRLDFCGRLRILESAISAIAQIGGENMRNLIAEMSRSGVRTSDIMSVLNIAERTAQYKVSGKESIHRMRGVSECGTPFSRDCALSICFVPTKLTPSRAQRRADRQEMN